MFILEALGELVEVFGGSRSGQEGPMSTKRCTCQRFGGSQEAITSPTPAPGQLRGMPPGASRASLMIIVCCLESLDCSEERALDRHDRRSGGLELNSRLAS